MKYRARATSFFFFLFLLVLNSLALHAQSWVKVAPNLLGTQEIETGAITHKSGITWAGSLRSVFMSPDSGITWIDRSPPILGKDNLDDITFYDNKIGLVCTNHGIVFRTDDQGMSWREIHRSQYAYSVAFLSSPDNIIVTSGPGGTIDVSRDGGVSWQLPYSPGGGAPEVRPLLGGGAMLLAGTLPGGSYHILRTNDYGMTWQQMPGTTDFDTYSFDVNPCDPRFIYVINEKGTISGNNQAEIFTSSDAGNSWTVSQGFPRIYFSGSVALTTKAVFVQTVSN
ncbi:MAG: WD40/YVTN/BNR-like repeat-containing protein, partial [Candidatus Kapaibacterium sp.]